MVDRQRSLLGFNVLCHALGSVTLHTLKVHCAAQAPAYTFVRPEFLSDALHLVGAFDLTRVLPELTRVLSQLTRMLPQLTCVLPQLTD